MFLQEGVKITAMDWSRADPNLIVSADDLGAIVCWDLFSNTTQQQNFGKLTPTCLSCCPHKRDLVAVGTRSGLLCVINIKGLYRSYYHTFLSLSLSLSLSLYGIMMYFPS